MNSKIYSAEIDKYYDKVVEYAIDQRIRDKCIEVANRVADDLIKDYHITRIIRKNIIEGAKKKVIIALEVIKKQTT